MIKESQQKYLNDLSPERANAPVFIKPYNPKLKIIADSVIGRIKSKIPDVDVRFMGASALEISGQNDIDIYAITESNYKLTYIEKLENIFGKWPERKWKWYEGGIEISVYLPDPDDYKLKEHIKLFSILKSDPRILKEYEKLKLSMNGKSYKEYQIAKYEFYNRVLGV